MSLAKEPYVPSPFTLTLLDNFGTRRLLHRPNNNSTTHMSHHRSEVKLRAAFDKESLLDQLRKEKARGKKMNVSSGYLRRQLSHTKQPPVPVPVPAPATVLAHRSIAASLKRQLQAVAGQVEVQVAQIARIKASKKYNRYAELITAKQVYEEELKAAAKRSARNRYALRERKRMWREHRRREEDTDAMDRVVRARLVQENKALAQQIEEQEARIRANLQRQAAQLRERGRLVRDILQLQRSTGKLYIVEGEEEAVENEQALRPPPNLYEEQEEQQESLVKEPLKKNNLHQDPDPSEGDSSEEQQSSSCSSSGLDEVSPSAPLPRRHNVSF